MKKLKFLITLIFLLSIFVASAKCALEFNPTLWKDIFSFLGWYGVAVFLFLSGYGLTLKYGFTTQQPFKAGTFVWKHLKRVFLLMIIPYMFFAIRNILRSQYRPVLLQLTLTSNIFAPNSISPGVYWFFGLIAQFYIFFALIRKYSSTRSASTGGGILLLINTLSLIMLFCLPDKVGILNYARHNFIGWILPFSMGILFAEYQSFGKLFNKTWKNAAWLIVCGLLVVISNSNYYTWCISPIFAIIASIGLTKVLSHYKWIDKGCVWFGTLSSFLFAVHPIVRLLCLQFCAEKMIHTLYILGYLLVSIALALVYKAIHKRFLSI